MNREEVIDRSFSKSASVYADHAVVQKRVASHLLNLLKPDASVRSVCDVGCGVGLQAPALQALYPAATLRLIDRSPGMCDQARCLFPDLDVIQADASQLPLADASVDVLFSSSMLQWSPCLESTLLEWARVLKPGGILAISCFLDGSLTEVRRSWETVDDCPHVNVLPSLHALTQACSALSWDRLHQSTATEKEYFSSAKAMVQSMRGVGSQTLTGELRQQGLLTPARWSQFCRSYQAFQESDGLLPLSYEVAYVLSQRR